MGLPERSMSMPETSAPLSLGVELVPLDDGASVGVIAVTKGGNADVDGGCVGQVWRTINSEPAASFAAKLAAGSLQIIFPIAVELGDGSALTIRGASAAAAPSLAELVLRSFPDGPPPRQRLLPCSDIATPLPDAIETIGDETLPAEGDEDTFIRRQQGDLRIVDNGPAARTMAQANRARLGLAPHSEAFEKFIADEYRARTDLNRRMIGCATSSYSIYPPDLYD
jgi:hypothetical protein